MPLNNYQQKLVSDNTPLVHHLTKRLPEHRREDAVATGMLALCEAALKYEPTKGKFSSYAARGIKWAINNYIRDSIRHSSFVYDKQVRDFDYEASAKKRYSYYQKDKGKDEDLAGEIAPPYQSFMSPEEYTLRKEAALKVKRAKQNARRAIKSKKRVSESFNERIKLIEKYYCDRLHEDHPKEALNISKQRVNQIWARYKAELRERLKPYAEYNDIPTPQHLED